MRISLPLALFALALIAAPPVLAEGAPGEVAGHMTPTRELDQQALGPGGLQKCTAYRRVLRHSGELQTADHGRLTPGDTRRLAAELKRARALPPTGLSPRQCGVPL